MRWESVAVGALVTRATRAMPVGEARALQRGPRRAPRVCARHACRARPTGARARLRRASGRAAASGARATRVRAPLHKAQFERCGTKVMNEARHHNPIMIRLITVKRTSPVPCASCNRNVSSFSCGTSCVPSRLPAYRSEVQKSVDNVISNYRHKLYKQGARASNAIF